MVEKLIKQLQDRDANVRRNAASLGTIGAGAADAVPALIQALKDRDKYVRSNAAKSLIQTVTPEGIKIGMSALIQALEDENKDVRREASSALGVIGQGGLAEEKAIDAIPDPIQVFKDDVVPALIQALKDENKDVRREAASALGRIGEEAKNAVPALIQALKGQDPEVRDTIVWALGKMGI